jgi:hypothetical protein
VVENLVYWDVRKEVLGVNWSRGNWVTHRRKQSRCWGSSRHQPS